MKKRFFGPLSGLSLNASHLLPAFAGPRLGLLPFARLVRQMQRQRRSLQPGAVGRCIAHCINEKHPWPEVPVPQNPIKPDSPRKNHPKQNFPGRPSIRRPNSRSPVRLPQIISSCAGPIKNLFDLQDLPETAATIAPEVPVHCGFDRSRPK